MADRSVADDSEVATRSMMSDLAGPDLGEPPCFVGGVFTQLPQLDELALAHLHLLILVACGGFGKIRAVRLA